MNQATEKQAAYAAAMVSELVSVGNDVPIPAGFASHFDWLLSLSQSDASTIIAHLEQMTGRQLMPTEQIRGRA